MTQETGKEVITKSNVIDVTAETKINPVYQTVVYKDFWQYVERKRWTREKVMKLEPSAREDFFMRWKHGMTDMNVNWEFEYSLRHFLKIYDGQCLQDIDPYYQEPLRLRRLFEEYCNKIKVEIGLWVKKDDVPKEVQDIADQFGGKVL